MKESKMKLFETSEYSIFKSHAQNRNLHEKSVKKMEESILKYGLIQPIIVSSDGYIIDGQHRLSACMRLGRDVTYVVNYSLTSKAVMEANNTQKKWTADDWVKHYAELGNVDYISLRNCTKKWSKRLTSGKIQYAFYKGTTSPSSSIKKGEYKIDFETGESVINNCIIMKKIVAEAFHTRFLRALKTVMLRNESFDINELVKKFRMKTFNFFYNEKDVVKEIIEVYNYKRKESKIS